MIKAAHGTKKVDIKVQPWQIVKYRQERAQDQFWFKTFCHLIGRSKSLHQAIDEITPRKITTNHDIVEFVSLLSSQKNLSAHLNVYLWSYLTNPKKIGDKIKAIHICK